MKKIIFLIIVLFTFFISCNKKSIKKTSYIVGINTNEHYPFEAKGEKVSGITGFEKELILEIAKRGNFKFEFIENSFDLNLKEIENDIIDMGIGIITITNQRKETMNFSKAYIKTEVIVLGNKEKKIIDKDNLKYGMIKGSYFKTLLEDKTNITIVEDIDTSKIIESLINQELDYIIIDRISWDKYTDKNLVLYEKEILGEELIGIAFSKLLSEEFTDKVDNIILNMELDGSLNRLKKKYNVNTKD